MKTTTTQRVSRRAFAALVAASGFSASVVAWAQDSVTVESVELDRPTVSSVGVQVLISGDDDGDATAELFVRPAGEDEWRPGLPMLRVLPDTVVGQSVPEQLAGSAIDLPPGADIELEVRIDDPDGGGGVETLTATTRPLPAAPAAVREVAVTSADELRAALQDAEPGDVIEVAAGTYTGAFSLNASGTEDAPIVLRGVARDDVVFDGEDCGGCNVFEIYGSYVHLEEFTIRNAVRALRFLGSGATGNVARRLRIEDVVHGIGSQSDQTDFYLCDNIVHGRLEWPLVSSDDGAQHNDDQGIRVDGDGHVVCHNEISGFGDPILNFAEAYRSFDVYGNDVFDIYGDGIEIDRAEGNVRVFRNRWTNVYTAISIQPVHGGPVYVFRNVAVNVADEQVKLKSVGGDILPSGALVFHNTFVSPEVALNLQTPITQYNFRFENNLFIGPADTTRGYTVDWTATIDGGMFDYNGYHPDGSFWFGRDTAGQNNLWDSFQEVQQGGVFEANGRLVAASPFANGFVAPDDYRTRHEPQELTLADDSSAVDTGRTIEGISHSFEGDAPDLGALELGCALPTYGPRAAGDDESSVVDPCATEPEPGGEDAGGGDADAGVPGPGSPDGGGGGPDDPGGPGPTPDAGETPDGGNGGANGGDDVAEDGCSCASANPSSALPLVFAVAIPLILRRRRRR